MVEEFTGNRYWESPGNVIAPRDHPATNMPTATEDHQGTQLGFRYKQGKSFYEQPDGSTVPETTSTRIGPK